MVDISNMCCPSCGAEAISSVSIECTAWIWFQADGTKQLEGADAQFDENSKCHCGFCDFAGTVGQLYTPARKDV